jgi:hypothetical protein
MSDTELLNPADKKDRMFVSDVSMGILLVAARREIGEALKRVLSTDMPDETKLSIISKYAESYRQGKNHDD